MKTIRNVILHCVPALTGSIPIAANGTVSSPNVGTIFRRGMKSQNKGPTEGERGKRGDPRSKQGGIMRRQESKKKNQNDRT